MSDDAGPETTEESAIQWYTFLIIVVLGVFSGIFSGLNLGVLGLDCKNLELLMMGPFETKQDEKDAWYAKKLLPLRRRGNLLLCAILLGNVSVNALLSILMADITSGTMGFITSTAVIVIFGEIVPQAICTRHGLAVGAYLSWLLYILIFCTCIIAFPISAILDKVLGEEVGNLLSANKMKRMFEMYEKEGRVNQSERKILSAALDLQHKTVKDAMTPYDKVFMLDINQVINHQLMKEIYMQGFSRIPIFDGDRQNIIGILMAKDLILFNPDRDHLALKQLRNIMREVVSMEVDTKLDTVLTYFQKGTTHMAIVCDVVQEENNDPVYTKIGLVTLEDVIEEILQAEINDEFEQADQNERKRLKEQLILLFTEHEAGKVLSSQELHAIVEYLSKYCKPFGMSRMKKSILIDLIKESMILEIESDDKPFTHLLEDNVRSIEVNLQQEDYKNFLTSLKTVKPKQPKFVNEKKMNRSETYKIGVTEKVNVTINSCEMGDESMANDEQKQAQKLEDLEQRMNPVLYVRQVPNDNFYLILGGKVTVCSGNEGFLVEQTTFNFLGADALINDQYCPDFSAKVIEKARLLKINRLEYRKAISSITNFQR